METRASARDGLELRHLRYVLALVELQSFRLAAAFLAIPLEVLSREIGTIERMLGGRLFHRLPRGASPTPAANEIAEMARRAFASRLTETRENTPDVTLSVGCVDYGRPR